jgi:hypothetical protein
MADVTTAGNNKANRPDRMALLTERDRVVERLDRLERALFTGIMPSEGSVYGLRAHTQAMGGGVVTYKNGRVRWTSRVIPISMGKGIDTASDGYFSITIPPDGSVITGVGGAANASVNADGIPLSQWQALYYVLPLGSGNLSAAGDFRIASYTAEMDVPPHWIPLALVMGDDIGKLMWLPERQWIAANGALRTGIERSPDFKYAMTFNGPASNTGPPTGTSGSPFTVPETGLYLVQFGGSCWRDSAGNSYMDLLFNGSQIANTQHYHNLTGVHMAFPGGVVNINLTAGVTYYIWHRVVNGSSDANDRFWTTVSS